MTYIYLACLALLLNACDDFLDTKASTEMPTDGAISSIVDAQSAINGCYDIMQQPAYYNQYYLIYGDIRGDDIQSDAAGQASYYLYVFDHYRLNAASSGFGLMWFYPLQLIRNASRIIEAIDNGSVKDGSEAARNQIKGHAIALRAMAHFDLVKVFGYPYKKNNGASWGAPVIDHVLKDDELPIRNTVAETYDFIIRELERAIPMMSTAKSNYNQLNAYGARALLARAYLYCEQNAKAYDTASLLVEELKGNDLYALYSNGNYAKAFVYNSNDTNFDPESLLEVFNTPTDNPGRNGLSYMCSPNGYSENMVTWSYADFLWGDENDVRHAVIGYYGNGAPYLNKYPGADGQAAFDNNYPLIRLSEVYLIAAEAAVKGGGSLTNGLTYLNVIVQRGNPENEVGDTDYTLDRVLDERRKEFIGEGHRYFDLLRNGITFSRSGGYHYKAATGYDIDWDFQLCVLPIPLDQFKLNPQLQQNDGYEIE